jgi:hypothetical protein
MYPLLEHTPKKAPWNKGEATPETAGGMGYSGSPADRSTVS